MPALLLYLLQVNAALLLFAAAYYLVLRRLTFFVLNRAYLLFALAFAALYPLVEVSAWLSQPVAALPTTRVFSEAWSALPPAAPTTNYWAMVVGAYWAGVGLLGLRLLGQLAALHRIHRASWPAQWRGHAYRRVSEAVNPFSFGQAIYLNPDQHAGTELPAVLCHEQAHVRQWHTVDTLVAQLLVVGCWFNPAAWLLRRAVRENLEFLADRAVLRADLLDAKAYQYGLVRLSTRAAGTTLANHFTFLTLKNRIIMLNKQRSTAAYLGCYALLIPGVSALLLACSAPEVDPTGRPALAEAEATAYKVRDSTLFFLDGERVDQATFDAVPGQGIHMWHYSTGGAFQQKYGAGIKAIELITTEAGETSEKVRAFRQRYGFQSLAEMKKWEAERPAREARERKEIRERDHTFALLPPALYVLDGIPTPEAQIGQLDYATIEHVNVLKGEQAVELYGEDGRNDVVVVTTKKRE